MLVNIRETGHIEGGCAGDYWLSTSALSITMAEHILSAGRALASPSQARRIITRVARAMSIQKVGGVKSLTIRPSEFPRRGLIMKFLLPSLAFLVAVNAQYFSAGWKPGQPAHTEAVKAPPKTADSGAPVKDDKLKERISPSSLLKMMDINYLLTTKPMVNLFSKAGMNISHRLAELEAVPWDTRVPLITDDNYFDLVVNETLSAEEEKDRVWAMVMYVSALLQTLSLNPL